MVQVLGEREGSGTESQGALHEVGSSTLGGLVVDGLKQRSKKGRYRLPEETLELLGSDRQEGVGEAGIPR